MSDAGPTIVAALAGAVIALGGSLGAQLISARASRKLKQAELLYAPKIRAYENVLEHANRFNAEPKKGEQYVQLLTSAKAATLVAPPDIVPLLDHPRNLSLLYVANRMRFAEDRSEINRLQIHEWYQIIEKLTSAMRKDLSGGFDQHN